MANYNLQTEIPSFLQGEDLPGEAIAIGVEAFEAAMAERGRAGVTLDDARQIAMSAIERYFRREGDRWIARADIEKMIKPEGGKYVLYSKDGSKKLGTFDSKEDAQEREAEINRIKHAKGALVDIPLIITKADVQPDGTMRWQAVTSDVGPDRTGESTSLSLFQDWIERAQAGKSVPFLPAPRAPFLGISHYPSLGGLGEAGPTEKMYIDGKRFKARGVFYGDSGHPLGPALFEAVKRENDLVQRGEAVEQPIRVSAAWWDLAHSHGNFIFERKSLTDTCSMCEQGAGGKVYLRGQLDHFAATRVPINPRTSLALEEKSMTTRKEDAASIVDEDLAEALEDKAKLVGKSETAAEPALVVKADKKKPVVDEEKEEETDDEEAGKKAKKVKADVAKMDAETAMEMGHYVPYGGATSMAAAMEYLETQEKLQTASSRLDLFNAVINNIMMYTPQAEQLAALKAATDEMNSELMAIKAAVADLWLIEPIQPGLLPVVEQSEVMMDQKYQQILEGALATLKSGATRAEKETGLQKALNELAQTMKADLDQANPAPQPTGNDLAEAFKAAIAPLAEQVSLLTAKLGQPQGGTYPVPQQKSFSVPALNLSKGQQGQPGAPVSPITGQPSELTALVRRSVGLY